MLKNVNDKKEDAINLLSLIKHTPKINLIPFNPWPGTFYETLFKQIKLFQYYYESWNPLQ